MKAIRKYEYLHSDSIKYINRMIIIGIYELSNAKLEFKKSNLISILKGKKYNYLSKFEMHTTTFKSLKCYSSGIIEVNYAKLINSGYVADVNQKIHLTVKGRDKYLMIIKNPECYKDYFDNYDNVPFEKLSENPDLINDKDVLGLCNLDIEEKYSTLAYDVVAEIITYISESPAKRGFTKRSRNILLQRIQGLSPTLEKLQTIANDYDRSRERIRQIVKKSHHAIKDSLICNENIIKVLKELNGEDTKSSTLNLLCFLINIYKSFAIDKAKFIVSFIIETEYISKYERLVELYFTKLKEFRKEHKDDKFTIWLKNNVIWPNNKRANLKYEFTKLRAERSVNFDSEFETGLFRSCKNDTVIEYESKQELNIINEFESSKYIWLYKAQSIVIKYDYERRRRYFPDFIILTENGEIIIVEAKSVFHMPQYLNLAKFKALEEYCAKHGYGYIIMDDRKRTFEELKNYKYNVDFECDILNSANKKNVLSWREIKKLMLMNSAKSRDLSSIVIKNNLKLEHHPFALSIR